MTPKADKIIRYFSSTFGMACVALGVALSIISNLGTSPLSCPAYVLNLWIPALSVGTFTLIINTSYILIQMAVLRKKFRAAMLLQIVASAIFGYMIDLFLFLFSWIAPATLVGRLGLILLSCLVTAFGTSIEVVANTWMLSAEQTVWAISQIVDRAFGRIKIHMDTLLVIISAVIAFIAFRNPFGGSEWTCVEDWIMARNPGIVIGLGTLISAFLIGFLMRFTDPVAAYLKLSDEKKVAKAEARRKAAPGSPETSGDEDMKKED